MNKEKFINTNYDSIKLEIRGRHKNNPNTKYIIISKDNKNIYIYDDCFIYFYGDSSDEYINYNYKDYNDTWCFE